MSLHKYIRLYNKSDEKDSGLPPVKEVPPMFGCLHTGVAIPRMEPTTKCLTLWRCSATSIGVKTRDILKLDILTLVRKDGRDHDRGVTAASVGVLTAVW